MEVAAEDLTMATVPIEIHLNPLDLISHRGPAPMAFALPRSSFLFSAIPAVTQAFRSHVADFGSDPNVWFEYEGAVVDWYHPFGVFADALTLERKSFPIELWARVTSDAIPASLPPVVRKKFQLLQTIHACKQACAAMFGGIKPVMDLPPNVQTAVSEFGMLTVASKGLRKGFEDGWAAIRQNATRNSNGSHIRYPVKLHLVEGIHSKRAKIFLVTLESFFDGLELPGSSAEIVADAATPKKDGDSGSLPVGDASPLATSTTEHSSLTQEQQNSVTLGDVLTKVLLLTPDQISQGLVCGLNGLPLNMPFLWLYSKFNYSDGCLHVVTTEQPTPPVAGGGH